MKKIQFGKTIARVTSRVRVVISFLIGTLAIFLALGASAQAQTKYYRLSTRKSPSRSMDIGWTQEARGENPVVHFGIVDHGQDAEAYAQTHKPDRSVSFLGMEHRFARLDHLTPNTRYYFVITTDSSTSPRMWFQTLPAGPAPIRFIAGGDSRTDPNMRRKSNLMVAKLRPYFVSFSGDFTVGSSTEQWRQWFDDWQKTISKDGRMTPFIPSRGNHEPSNKFLYNLFDIPNKDNYYALSVGGDYMRIYMLNTEISVSGKQEKWLTRDLKRHQDAHWKIAQYHKPIRPHQSTKPNSEKLYKAFALSFYKYGVNLSVEGDSHVVKITDPIRPAQSDEKNVDAGFVRDPKTGTMYIGEGTWAAPPHHPTDRKFSWTLKSGSFSQFKWILATPQKMAIRTVKVDNAQKVSPVDSSNPWKLPENIELWEVNGQKTLMLPAHAKK